MAGGGGRRRISGVEVGLGGEIREEIQRQDVTEGDTHAAISVEINTVMCHVMCFP